MPEQIRTPYGDAFIFQTPALDRLTQQLYADQKQKELYRQQQSKALDDEFARNAAGIRDADVGKLAQRYGEYKIAAQNILRMRTKTISPDQQMDAIRKKAAIYDVITKSKERKGWEEAQGKQIMTDRKGFYADNAHNLLIESMRTPVDEIDYSKDADLLYKYYLPDLNKELKAARGDSNEVTVTLGKSLTDPMKDDKEIYKVGNTPVKFYNTMLKEVVSANKGRNYSGVLNNQYTDQELEDLTNKYYAKINDPKFKAVYGEPQPFPESTGTDLGKAVMINTMEEFVNSNLAPIRKVSEINVDRATKDRQKFAIEQQERAQKNSLARLYVLERIRDKNPLLIGQRINGLVGDMIADGRDHGGVVETDDRTFEVLTGKKKTRNSVLKVDESGNFEYGKYKTDDEGNVTTEFEKTGNIPFELSITKLTQGYKAGLDPRYNTGEKKPPVSELKESYKLGGKTFSRAQVEKAAKQQGYSVEEYIKRAGLQ